MKKEKSIIFFISIALVSLVGLFALFTTFSSDKTHKSQESVDNEEQNTARISEQYETDTYGGVTPEETLTLFFDALKNEDIERASMYFLPEEREEQKSYLVRVKENDGDFNKFLKDAEKLTLSGKSEERAFYTIVDENNVVEVQVVLGKNPLTGVWKIIEL